MEKHLAWLAVLSLALSVFLSLSCVSFARRCPLLLNITLSRISKHNWGRLQNSVKLGAIQTGELPGRKRLPEEPGISASRRNRGMGTVEISNSLTGYGEGKVL